jgi:hypothetical protein
MIHTEIPVDREMLAWVMAKEKELAPEASEVVFHNPATLDYLTLARLAADGLRIDSGAEIGFCHPYQVIRDVLPVGPIDYNAIFLSGGQRGEKCVFVELTGAEIAAYVNGLHQIQREPPEWSGFRVARDAGPDGVRRTDLDPARTYKVVMPLIEWETRFLRLAADAKKKGVLAPLGLREIETTPAPVNYTDSLRASIKRLLAKGENLRGYAYRIAARREL